MRALNISPADIVKSHLIGKELLVDDVMDIWAPIVDVTFVSGLTIHVVMFNSGSKVIADVVECNEYIKIR